MSSHSLLNDMITNKMNLLICYSYSHTFISEFIAMDEFSRSFSYEIFELETLQSEKLTSYSFTLRFRLCFQGQHTLTTLSSKQGINIDVHDVEELNSYDNSYFVSH
ncbi:CLUMA_CG007044, isoform D [Clunio marinus]|uniref:CLUMA_CG007044, isoform D n=1 Tax=Clunio marinus TaxID=568069 RepID=A0A1J1HZH8_9DIPT|nr:CLUMA_CG007044, isoform D [Clunio marinus]